MKIAIVHDSLNEFGGAERVLNVLLKIFPQSHLYTGFADRKLYSRHFPLLHHRLHTSWIQSFPVGTHTSLVQLLSPLIWNSFSFGDYDVVISHSFHIMSNLVRVPNGVHIAYIQSPPKNIIGIEPKTPLQTIIPYTETIRGIYTNALTSSYNLVNSFHTQSILKEYLNIPSHVLYPPVQLPKNISNRRRGSYFLCVSRLDRGKNLELAILACNALKAPLKIAGVTNEPRFEMYLRHIAGPTIEFLGFVPDKKLDALYEHAIAFLFPSKSEDFGIAPLEATAHGIPVIGFYGGGTKETIVEGETGTFFREHTVESLQKAIKKIRTMHFNTLRMYAWAKRFSEAHFRQKLLKYVDTALSERQKKRSQ